MEHHELTTIIIFDQLKKLLATDHPDTRAK